MQQFTFKREDVADFLTNNPNADQLLFTYKANSGPGQSGVPSLDFTGLDTTARSTGTKTNGCPFPPGCR